MKIKTIMAIGLFGLLFMQASFAASIGKDDNLIAKSFLLATAPNQRDMRQAEQFIDSLPTACSGSYITTKGDGTVVIHLHCRKANESTNGKIEIKDGIVKRIE